MFITLPTTVGWIRLGQRPELHTSQNMHIYRWVHSLQQRVKQHRTLMVTRATWFPPPREWRDLRPRALNFRLSGRPCHVQFAITLEPEVAEERGDTTEEEWSFYADAFSQSAWTCEGNCRDYWLKHAILFFHYTLLAALKGYKDNCYQI